MPSIHYLKDLALLNEYKKVRNKSNSYLKKARAKYYKNIIHAVSDEPKKVWNTLRSLIGQEEIPFLAC